jgi:hypothetical protein
MRLYYLILSEFEPKAYMAQIIGSKGPLSKPTTAAQPWRRGRDRLMRVESGPSRFARPLMPVL